MKKVIVILLLMSYSSYSLSNIIYVDRWATGMNNGSSWIDAYTNLSVALLNTNNRDTVWIATGTYKADRDLSGNLNPIDNRTKCFKIGNVGDTIRLIGGFIGNETNENQANPKTNIVNIDGDIGVIGDNQDNSYRMFEVVAKKVEIVGLRFKNGFSDQNGAVIVFQNFNEEALISNCEFLNNETSQTGGCVYNVTSNRLTIEKSDFTYNSALLKGGAIYSDNVNTIVNDCYFYACDSQKGGAIYLKGGINSDPHKVCYSGFYSCTPLNQGAGSALYGDSAFIRMSNCSTFFCPGDLASDKCFDYVVNNSIVSEGYIVDGNNVFSMGNCIIQSAYNPNGMNNINIDPLYIFGSLNISACSPARNAGDNSLMEPDVMLPQYGIQEGNIDIGAYEFVLPVIGMDSTNLLILTPLDDLSFESYYFIDCETNNPISPPWLTPDTTGSYAMIIESEGCYDTSNCVAFVSYVGIEEYTQNNRIRIYPNPATDNLNVILKDDMQGLKYEIFDATGSVVHSNIALSNEFVIDSSEFESGLYWFSSNGEVLKILINH